MINFKLDTLLKQHKCSRTHFAHITKVRPNTISDMCNGKTKRLELDTLNSIMRALNQLSNKQVFIGDLIEYKEGEE